MFGSIAKFEFGYQTRNPVFWVAAILFFLGTPGWLDRTWFFAGALATVIAWQVAEVVAFSRLRTPLYNDASETGGAPDDADDAPRPGTTSALRRTEGH